MASIPATNRSKTGRAEGPQGSSGEHAAAGSAKRSMTTERPAKEFDCVATMRRIRDQISAEMGGLSDEQLSRWLKSRRYSQPLVRRLAGRTAGPAPPEERTAPTPTDP